MDSAVRDGSSSWIEAMKLEFESLTRLNTWEPVPLSKDGKMQTNEVYAWKKNVQVMVIRNKALLVAKGFTQIPGIDLNRYMHQIQCIPPYP